MKPAAILIIVLFTFVLLLVVSYVLSKHTNNMVSMGYYMIEVYLTPYTPTLEEMGFMS